MKLWTKSPVWQYFGLAVDEDRKIKSDDLPCTVPTWNFLPVTLVSNKLFKSYVWMHISYLIAWLFSVSLEPRVTIFLQSCKRKSRM